MAVALRYWFTWLRLLNVSWCVAGRFWTWAICNDVDPSCCVTMWCDWFVLDVSTMVCVDWLGATDTEIPWPWDCWIWICWACSWCEVEDISSGSFFTVTVCKFGMLLLVPKKNERNIDTLRCECIGQTDFIWTHFYALSWCLALRSVLIPNDDVGFATV